MQTSYAQKNDTVQMALTNTVDSVVDSSSQSATLQRHASLADGTVQRASLPPRPNNTGMPDNLKSGIESLSGFSMDDVRVHYNSSKPATVQALAYTQGTDIHVAPGQEKHLPHEAWHVAQQMAGRVSPTTNINGMPVNDNAALEHEADVMGEKAVQCKSVACNEKNTVCKNDNLVHLKKCIQLVGDKVFCQKGDTKDLCFSELYGVYEKYVSDVGVGSTSLKKKRDECRKAFVTCKISKDENAVSNAQKTLGVDGSLGEKEYTSALIQAYEQKQIANALHVEELKKLLEEKIKEIKGKNGNDCGYRLLCSGERDCKSFSIMHDDKVLFRVYVDDDRFDTSNPISYSEDGVVGKIYKRHDDSSGKEYVKTANACFVPRFVYRNLGAQDKGNIEYNEDGSIKELKKDILCDVDSINPLYLKCDCSLGEYVYDEEKKNLSDEDEQCALLTSSNPNVYKIHKEKKFLLNANEARKVKVACAKDYFGKSHTLEKPLSCFDNDNDNGSALARVVKKIEMNIKEEKKQEMFQFFSKEEKPDDKFWVLYNMNVNDLNIEILDHQRAKVKQMGSGFISCTATKHPIFGNSAHDFYRGKKDDPIDAVAKIDLIQVGLDNVYSTYSKKAMKDLYGLDEPTYLKDEVNTDTNRAARDAMRTREIVINGPIPKKAIVEIYYDKKNGDEHTFEEYGTIGTKRLLWSQKK